MGIINRDSYVKALKASGAYPSAVHIKPLKLQTLFAFAGSMLEFVAAFFWNMAHPYGSPHVESKKCIYSRLHGGPVAQGTVVSQGAMCFSLLGVVIQRFCNAVTSTLNPKP